MVSHSLDSVGSLELERIHIGVHHGVVQRPVSPLQRREIGLREPVPVEEDAPEMGIRVRLDEGPEIRQHRLDTGRDLAARRAGYFVGDAQLKFVRDCLRVTVGPDDDRDIAQRALGNVRGLAVEQPRDRRRDLFGRRLGT